MPPANQRRSLVGRISSVPVNPVPDIGSGSRNREAHDRRIRLMGGDLMPYASGRTFLDADSHIMELPGFLRDHADPEVRDLLPEIGFSSGGKLAGALERLSNAGGHSPEEVEKLVELGDTLIAGPKGYEALGAFNATERSRALDLLGFHRQFVFATFSPGLMF